MYFPISDVFINPLYLILVGFLVGLLGGFFGVGGGFIAAPALFWTGMPLIGVLTGMHWPVRQTVHGRD